MALKDLTERSAVLAAIAEAKELGEDAFLAKYGFEPSRRFRIAHNGETFSSKAILGVAHGIQFPEQGPLRSSEFSGGRETNAKADSLGFEIVEIEAKPDDLGIALSRFMDLFAEARRGKFGHDHPAVEALRGSAAALADLLPPSLQRATVRPSVGQGNWASVPWVAVLHPDVTTTTQHGVYPVLLFYEDLSAVEVTIAQGVMDLKREVGRRAAVRELEHTAERLRPSLGLLRAHGFHLDAVYDLGHSSLARDYIASTVVHREYRRDELTTSTISQDVRRLLDAYGNLLIAGELVEGPKDLDRLKRPHALMIYVGQAASANFETRGREGWWGWKQAPTAIEALRPGDLVAFGRGYDGGSPRVESTIWARHRLREVVVGRITDTPERTDQQVMPDEVRGEAAYPWKLRFEPLGSVRDVALGDGNALSTEAADALRRSAINRGVGILVPIAGSSLLEQFAPDQTEAPRKAPADIFASCEAFVKGVDECGLSLPSEDVVAFFAALIAKPFVILAGQSGSGKTQLAMKLADWLGSDHMGRPRSLLVPVRPDWTGPEYLFGYPDALRSAPGKEVWAVPDALEFIFRARDEPHEPYLLVLDEMNLAHVERYFADFLSGAESRHPVLPELTYVDGEWVAVGNAQRLPLPRNLIVVGTVNVDETTYLFSPKVLDRAFVFEFRTNSSDLDHALRRPSACGVGEAAQRRTLAAALADDDWQFANAHPESDAIAEHLRTLHRLLSSSGHDFGQRVFYEALRYASLLAAVGMGDQWAVLDNVTLAKLLPKIHGTRARLEDTLREVRRYADGELPDAERPRMPKTVAKLDRMLKVIVEAQFVSFTE